MISATISFTFLGEGKVVNIGSHSVIGACSLINKDIPPYSTAAGIPCRVIGDIEIDESDVKFHHIKDD